MNRLQLLSISLAAFAALGAHAAPTWMTDLPAAKAKALEEKKMVLIEFTGSDWCPACINLKKTALSSSTFESYAASNLVLVELDFPRKKELSAAMQKANEEWAQVYGVRYFPTLILLNSAGEKLTEIPAIPDGEQLVAQFKKVTEGKSIKPPSPEPPVPLFNGAAALPPPRYTELKLKSISGRPGKRLAMVNNQTMAEGESSRIRINDRDVVVKCVEIREKSIVVSLDGRDERQEIFGSW